MNRLDEINLKYGNAKGSPCHNYFPKYEEKLSQSIEIKTILEIGVLHGESLKIWKERWPEARIFGIDINDVPEMNIEGIKVFKGAQQDKEFIEECLKEIGSQIDLIIDDGGHLPEQYFASLSFLFPHLTPGGLYFIEDVFTGTCLKGYDFFPRLIQSAGQYGLMSEDERKSNLDDIELSRGDRDHWLVVLRKKKDA